MRSVDLKDPIVINPAAFVYGCDYDLCTMSYDDYELLDVCMEILQPNDTMPGMFFVGDVRYGRYSIYRCCSNSSKKEMTSKQYELRRCCGNEFETWAHYMTSDREIFYKLGYAVIYVYLNLGIDEDGCSDIVERRVVKEVIYNPCTQTEISCMNKS